PGYWPAFAEWRSFDPAIEPSMGATRGCTFVGGYGAAAMGAQVVGDYECGSNSLNLPNREAQVDKVLEPAALGWATWVESLWMARYWRYTHDQLGQTVTHVDESAVADIGVIGNQAVGQYPNPTDPSGTLLA